MNADLRIYTELIQSSDEWLAARAGMLTASTIGKLITKGSPDALTVDCPQCGALADSSCISTGRKVPVPIKTIHNERTYQASTLPPVFEVADNDTSRGLTETLVAERITGRVVMVNPTQDMQRGTLDEPYAREMYAEQHAPVNEIGFAVRTFGAYQLGASPDGLVGADGGIEIKSRAPKTQIRTILTDTIPAENMAQIQACMFVMERNWWDYCSYAGNFPLYVKRVYADTAWQEAIIEALDTFETNAAQMIAAYTAATDGLPVAPFIDHYEEIVIR